MVVVGRGNKWEGGFGGSTKKDDRVAGAAGRLVVVGSSAVAVVRVRWQARVATMVGNR